MTTQYPKIVGAVRTILIIAGWGAATAVVQLFADPANLGQWFSPTVAGLIAAFFGSLEQKMQSEGKGALFGAVK